MKGFTRWVLHFVEKLNITNLYEQNQELRKELKEALINR